MTFLGPLGILTHLNWTGSMTLVEAAWDFEPRGTKTFLGPLGILTHLNWTGSMTLVEVAWDFEPGGTMTWPGTTMGFLNPDGTFGENALVTAQCTVAFTKQICGWSRR